MLTFGKKGTRMTFTLSTHQLISMFQWGVSYAFSTAGEVLCLGVLTWQRPLGDLTVFQRAWKTTYQRKKQLQLESTSTTETKPICWRDLGSHQPKSIVRVLFTASGIGGYFNLCLGIVSNRKFYLLSSSLFKITLIRKLFLILRQTSVMYKSPLCSYVCPLKLYRISLVPLPFIAQQKVQCSYHIILSFSALLSSYTFCAGSIPLFLI